ncbi:MAG: hypothetical protein KDE58_13045 [Caldilineaceae bacterium]|nr:hypothetical protein [Caldilineaceae bacterium]
MARFKTGESGNPKGRPKGVADKRTQYRKLLEPHADILIQKVVDLALEGDTTALRLCLERICPPIKATDSPVVFPFPKDAPLADAGNAILQAAAAGVLSPQQAQQLLSAVATQAKIIETDELARRVEALEQAHAST